MISTRLTCKKRKPLLQDSKGAQPLWWGPGQSPGGVRGKAPVGSTKKYHLSIKGNADIAFVIGAENAHGDDIAGFVAIFDKAAV